jgi:hypothetical protein
VPTTSPYPVLQVHTESSLTFPWSEYQGKRTEGTFDASLGKEGGASVALVMMIFWSDLQTAVQQILGYSWIDTANTTIHGLSRLRRVPPWQHPYFNQLWARRISKIQGIQQRGKTSSGFLTTIGGIGQGELPNLGPWTDFKYALLTIQFWRPPYALRTDNDINSLVPNDPWEWLRWTDRNWEASYQMLSRESGALAFLDEQQRLATGLVFPGSVGQKVVKMKLKRRWYEVPEEFLFIKTVDATPSGIPANMLYTQSRVRNPITNYIYPKGWPILGSVNAPINGTVTMNSTRGFVTNGSAVVTNIPSTAGMAPGFSVDGVGSPNTILSVDSGTQITLVVAADCQTKASGLGAVLVVEDPDLRFMGCPMGTLLLEAVEFVPQALHLPPILMNIPSFNNGEPISQVQYDVVFHFEYFDPPRNPSGCAWRGHNLMPYYGDGFWYAVKGQKNVFDVTSVSGLITPFAYADFSELFRAVL